MKVDSLIARLFLTSIGLLYLALAAWCCLDPGTTSRKVGFTLNGDSGASEFLTVYGGLEFGLALVFLMPLAHATSTRFSLLSCLLIHGSLVTFRSVSLLIHHDFGAMTGKLAIGECLIFLVGLVIWFTTARAPGCVSA